MDITHCRNKPTDRSHAPTTTFASLPAELRIEIWRHAIEPQLAFIHDIIERPRAYSLPGVAQLNAEARRECLPCYERVEQGPYFQFDRDIFICDHKFVDQLYNDFFDILALRVQRLALWDCVPDDYHVADPSSYQEKLHDCFGLRISERIDFGKLWFSNLKELWIVKIGDVDPAWGVKRDANASRDDQLRQLARQFRYWVREGIIEMTPLNLEESDTKFLLDHGRCREETCQELNRSRPMMVSQVLFMDSLYKDRSPDTTKWTRIAPRSNEADEDDEITETSRMRWALVERMIMFSLRWDISGDDDGDSDNAKHKRKRTIAAEC
jgi:hypothetical protein